MATSASWRWMSSRSVAEEDTPNHRHRVELCESESAWAELRCGKVSKERTFSNSLRFPPPNSTRLRLAFSATPREGSDAWRSSLARQKPLEGRFFSDFCRASSYLRSNTGERFPYGDRLAEKHAFFHHPSVRQTHAGSYSNSEPIFTCVS
jgi:hypothetical protein